MKYLDSEFLLPFRNKDFTSMWIATLYSGATMWTTNLARAALVWNISESSNWVGLILFALMIPSLLVPLIAGFIADWIDRKKMLILASIGSLISNGLMVLVLVLFDVTNELLVYIVAFSALEGIARAFRMPASQSLVPNLVSKDDVPKAVALLNANQHGAKLIGPLVVGFLTIIIKTGFLEVFIVCFSLNIAAVLTILLIRTESTGVIDSEKSFGANFLQGFDYLYHNTWMLIVLVVAMLHCALTMTYESLTPSIGEEVLILGSSSYTSLMLFAGIGAVLGSTIVVTMKTKIGGYLFFFSAFLSGFAPVLLALSDSLYIIWLSLLLIGASQAAFMTLTHVIIQVIVPDEIRGRVTSIYIMHVGSMMALFNWINGYLADITNPRTVLMFMGIIFIAAIIISLVNKTAKTLFFIGIEDSSNVQMKGSSA